MNYRIGKITMQVALLFCGLSLLSTPQAWADDALTGLYRLDQETCTAAEKTGCKISLEIAGPAAKLLYENMTSVAEDEPCTGGKVKIDNDALRCFFNEGDTYSCDVGYNFSAKKLVFSDVTC